MLQGHDWKEVKNLNVDFGKNKARMIINFLSTC